MKIWRFPPEQLEKWLAWQERHKKRHEAFVWIEEVTGIKPLLLNDGGHFQFIPAEGGVIPKHWELYT